MLAHNNIISLIPVDCFFRKFFFRGLDASVVNFLVVLIEASQTVSLSSISTYVVNAI